MQSLIKKIYFPFFIFIFSTASLALAAENWSGLYLTGQCGFTTPKIDGGCIFYRIDVEEVANPVGIETKAEIAVYHSWYEQTHLTARVVSTNDKISFYAKQKEDESDYFKQGSIKANDLLLALKKYKDHFNPIWGKLRPLYKSKDKLQFERFPQGVRLVEIWMGHSRGNWAEGMAFIGSDQIVWIDNKEKSKYHSLERSKDSGLISIIDGPRKGMYFKWEPNMLDEITVYENENLAKVKTRNAYDGSFYKKIDPNSLEPDMHFPSKKE